MQCPECGKDFRPKRDWQRVCNQRCRSAFHNREAGEAQRQAARDRYADAVAAHEARMNGHAPARDDLVAQLELLKPTPTVWRRPLASPKKKDEGEDQQVA